MRSKEFISGYLQIGICKTLRYELITCNFQGLFSDFWKIESTFAFSNNHYLFMKKILRSLRNRLVLFCKCTMGTGHIALEDCNDLLYMQIAIHNRIATDTHGIHLTLTDTEGSPSSRPGEGSGLLFFRSWLPAWKSGVLGSNSWSNSSTIKSGIFDYGHLFWLVMQIAVFLGHPHISNTALCRRNQVLVPGGNKILLPHRHIFVQANMFADNFSFQLHSGSYILPGQRLIHSSLYHASIHTYTESLLPRFTSCRRLRPLSASLQL